MMRSISVACATTSWIVSIAWAGVRIRSFSPAAIGVAVQNSAASSANLSASARSGEFSALYQPPVPGGPWCVRDRVTSFLRADTLYDGVVVMISCSMYEPSDDAKYFHSDTVLTEAVAVTTSLFFAAASTIAWTNA